MNNRGLKVVYWQDVSISLDFFTQSSNPDFKSLIVHFRIDSKITKTGSITGSMLETGDGIVFFESYIWSDTDIMHVINSKTDTSSDFFISSSYRNRIIYKINKVHITQAMSTDREKIEEAFDSRELILIVFVKVSFG